MNLRGFHRRAPLFAAAFALCLSARAAPLPEYRAIAAPPVDMAREFLASLGPEASSVAVLPVDHPARAQWSNLPARMVARAGVRSGDLSDQQRALLFEFLSAALGPQGYRAVGDAVAAEDALARLEPDEAWSSDNYWLAFFGEPGADEEWGWHFGGHHLAVNMALAGNDIVSVSPTFIGAEPINFVLEGRTHRPLAEMRRAGAAVYAALDQDRRADARLRSLFGIRRLEAGAGEDGSIPSPEGSRAGEWSDAQRALLLDAIGEWVNLQPPAAAGRRMRALAAELDDTYFAWRGPIDGSDDTYFRIQGPSVIIELLLQGDADREGHYHSVYRNPGNEYGGQLK